MINQALQAASLVLTFYYYFTKDTLQRHQVLGAIEETSISDRC